MPSFKQLAMDYTPRQTLNITDLDILDLNLDLKVENREGMDKEGKTFEYQVAIINEQEYRIPSSVLEELKKILELKPDVEKVKVTKTGSGLNTRYSVKVIQ